MATAAVEFLPKEYGYVVLVLVLYCFLNVWMAAQVGKARRKLVSPSFFHPNFNWIEQKSIVFISNFVFLFWVLNIVVLFFCFFNRYKVSYPTLYASESENKDAKLFNCVQVCPSINLLGFSVKFGFELFFWWSTKKLLLQRGHQNSLEMMPMFFILMILGGMRHPCVSAGFGLLYIVGRYFYFTGYATGDPQNRLKIGFVIIFPWLRLWLIRSFGEISLWFFQYEHLRFVCYKFLFFILCKHFNTKNWLKGYNSTNTYIISYQKASKELAYTCINKIMQIGFRMHWYYWTLRLFCCLIK